MKFGKFQPDVEQYNYMTGYMNYRFYFTNGYGADVAVGPYTYGGPQWLYELAVLKYAGLCWNWEITYETTITDHVEKYLTKKDVEKLLERISKL